MWKSGTKTKSRKRRRWPGKRFSRSIRTSKATISTYVSPTKLSGKKRPAYNRQPNDTKITTVIASSLEPTFASSLEFAYNRYQLPHQQFLTLRPGLLPGYTHSTTRVGSGLDLSIRWAFQDLPKPGNTVGCSLLPDGRQS